MTIPYFSHQSAEVSDLAEIGKETKIWHQSQVRENAKIGENCIIAKNVYIDFEVKIGNNVKIQNNSSIYHGSTIADNVFIGPHVCLTNDKNPRATNPDGSQKSEEDWETGIIKIGKGASIGACSVILPDVEIGEYALIGAGSVVTKSIPPHTLAYGNPAKPAGLVCFCGQKLDPENHCKKCDKTIDIN